MRNGAARGDAVVFAGKLGAVLDLFEVAAWLEATEALLVELCPVVDGCVAGAEMDEVEAVVAEGPRVVEVVDFEFAVRWYPVWLDGGQVGSDHSTVRVFVGEVDGPDAGAGAEVEDCTYS